MNRLRLAAMFWAAGIGVYFISVFTAAAGRWWWTILAGVAAGLFATGYYQLGYHRGFYDSWAQDWDEDCDQEHEQCGVDWDGEWLKLDAKESGDWK